MVVVFGSFLLENDRVLKLMGIGLATAIALDATVVRMLLVPATMELLGDKNWWLPRWLGKVLPNFDVEGHARRRHTGRRAADGARLAPRDRLDRGHGEILGDRQLVEVVSPTLHHCAPLLKVTRPVICTFQLVLLRVRKLAGSGFHGDLRFR